MNFKNNLLYGLGLSLVLLFISSLASYVSIRNLIESSSMVRDSNQTIKDLDRIFSLVKDAETGQRGYLLTRDDRFLQPYTNAKDKIADAMNQLSIEVSKTNTQSKNLDKLKFNVENRLQILEDNLNYRKQNNVVTSEQLLAGKKYMDAIRNKVAIMQAEEQAILQNRTASMERFASFTPWLIVVSALLAITITLVFYRKVLQDFNEKTKLTDELEEKNEETENRLIAIEKVAAQISGGDYNILWDQNAQKTLGSVAGPLNRMAESLQTSFESLGDKEWLSTSVTQLNDRMMGDKNISALSAEILELITAKTGSQVAALYVQEEDNRLHLTGTYALADRDMKKALQIGEGIAGQAFQSRKQIVVQNIPDDGNTISFATGNTKPKNIVDRKSVV